MTIIHVDGPRLKRNRETGSSLPVIRIVQGQQVLWAKEVEILGPSTIIQHGAGVPPLEGYPNATTWIETTAPIRARVERAIPVVRPLARRRGKDLDQRPAPR